MLIYVHGTNGSGKSTLARALVAAAGGAVGVENLARTKGQKGFTTYTNEGVVMLGRYGNACGGVDGFSPYAVIHEVMDHHTSTDDACRVFAEGLVTPGIATCQNLARMVDNHLFIALVTPTEDCIANVLKRRRAKGTAKPYNPANLYRKADSVHSWANRIEKAGLSVKRLSWRMAYLECTALLGLDNLNHLL